MMEMVLQLDMARMKVRNLTAVVITCVLSTVCSHQIITISTWRFTSKCGSGSSILVRQIQKYCLGSRLMQVMLGQCIALVVQSDQLHNNIRVLTEKTESHTRNIDPQCAQNTTLHVRSAARCALNNAHLDTRTLHCFQHICCLQLDMIPQI